MLRNIIGLIVLSSTALSAGCATTSGYQKAFAEQSAIKGNHQGFDAPADQAFRAVKLTLVRQGFTVEQADYNSGLIKASRNFLDQDDENVSYNIIATADVTADDVNSVVTLAASQQTVLHRKWHTWWHLLWIVPLFPTGTEYQTVVTHEGNVTDAAFYRDFFSAVAKSIAASKPLVVTRPLEPADVLKEAGEPTPVILDAPSVAEPSAPTDAVPTQAVQ